MWFDAIWHVLSVLTDVGSVGLVVGTTAAVGALLVTLLITAELLRAGTATVAPQVTFRALRERARRAGVPRHRDPDAAGRSRPRAPTLAVPAV